MSVATPLKNFISWLKAEDDEEEYDTMAPTNDPTPAPSAPPKRQRGPLLLRENADGGMEIRHPRSLDDRMAIGNDLKQRRLVTLDLTKLPEADARYFLEFIYGVVFALDATAEKVTEGIYLLAPRGVDVHNDVATEPVPAAKTPAGHTGQSSLLEQDELFWQGR
ncbi:MAG TPA: cell division protein SepF [Armatimonadota bacterium]|jgi:cell division inhibitor SepF